MKYNSFLFCVLLVSGINSGNMVSHAQEKIKYSNTEQIETSFWESEHFFWGSSDMKWKPEWAYSAIRLSFNSSPMLNYQIDASDIMFGVFNFTGISMVANKTPAEGFLYWLPFGITLPVICGQKFVFGLESKLYLLSTDVKAHGSELWSGTPPNFIDTKFRFDYYPSDKFGLSFFAGYNSQIGDWNLTSEKKKKYTSDISGPYLGISLGVQWISITNRALDMWNTIKYSESPYDYERFLSLYPKTPYINIATTKIKTLQEIEEKEWDNLRQSTTGIFEIVSFLKKYFKSEHLDSARIILFNKLKETDDIEQYLTVADQFTNSKYSTEIHDTIYSKATAINKIEYYERYLSKYPTSRYSASIADRVHSILKDNIKKGMTMGQVREIFPKFDGKSEKASFLEKFRQNAEWAGVQTSGQINIRGRICLLYYEFVFKNGLLESFSFEKEY